MVCHNPEIVSSLIGQALHLRFVRPQHQLAALVVVLRLLAQSFPSQHCPVQPLHEHPAVPPWAAATGCQQYHPAH